jgi:hypothetical protein
VSTTPADPRIAVGAECLWWGPVTEAVARTETCPHCGLQCAIFADEAAWWADVEAFASTPRFPDYRQILEWLREGDRHFASWTEARAAYDERLIVDTRWSDGRVSHRLRLDPDEPLRLTFEALVDGVWVIVEDFDDDRAARLLALALVAHAAGGSAVDLGTVDLEAP